jgi:hypothetical protein
VLPIKNSPSGTYTNGTSPFVEFHIVPGGIAVGSGDAVGDGEIVGVGVDVSSMGVLVAVGVASSGMVNVGEGVIPAGSLVATVETWVTVGEPAVGEQAQASANNNPITKIFDVRFITFLPVQDGQSRHYSV